MNSYAKFDRLRKAIKFRGLDPKRLDIDLLLDKLISRGITDNALNGILWKFLSVLEPPACQMSHCRHYGHQSAFCNCSKGEIPGKCKIHRDYLKRRKERGIKDVDLLLAAMAEQFKKTDVLHEISIEIIKSGDFFYKLAKLKHLSFLKKWNYSRFEEVRKLLLIRKKKELMK